MVVSHRRNPDSRHRHLVYLHDGTVTDTNEILVASKGMGKNCIQVNM